MPFAAKMTTQSEKEEFADIMASPKRQGLTIAQIAKKFDINVKTIYYKLEDEEISELIARKRNLIAREKLPLVDDALFARAIKTGDPKCVELIWERFEGFVRRQHIETKNTDLTPEEKKERESKVKEFFNKLGVTMPNQCTDTPKEEDKLKEEAFLSDSKNVNNDLDAQLPKEEVKLVSFTIDPVKVGNSQIEQYNALNTEKPETKNQTPTKEVTQNDISSPSRQEVIHRLGVIHKIDGKLPENTGSINSYPQDNHIVDKSVPRDTTSIDSTPSTPTVNQHPYTPISVPYSPTPPPLQNNIMDLGRPIIYDTECIPTVTDSYSLSDTGHFCNCSYAEISVETKDLESYIICKKCKLRVKE